MIEKWRTSMTGLCAGPGHKGYTPTVAAVPDRLEGVVKPMSSKDVQHIVNKAHGLKRFRIVRTFVDQ